VAYTKKLCEFCQKQVSTGGAAFTAHMRMHVRKNEAIELKQNGKLIFMKPGIDILDTEPYAKFNQKFMPLDPLPGQPKDTWLLPNIKEILPAIDPSSYFITSGEAVKKSEKLVKDVFALSNHCRQLRDGLRKARGIKKYLELNHDGGYVLVRGKDPRIKKDQ
jgi:hypothetical protein